MPHIINLDAYGKEGFKLDWDADSQPGDFWTILNDVKRHILGIRWDAKLKKWVSDGPEILLDMQRFGYDVRPTQAAYERAVAFMERIEAILDARDRSVNGHMYGFQEIGTEVLLLQERGILADDMGLGKTKQALEALNQIWPVPTIILVPNSLVYNWKNEFEKWTDIPFEIVEGGPKQRAKFWASKPWERSVILTNLEKVRMDDFPMDAPWGCVIVDEATKFKNWQSQMSKAFAKLTGNLYEEDAKGKPIYSEIVREAPKYVWLLTGTPLEVRGQELYQMMRYTRPAVFGFPSRFRDAHLITNEWSGSAIGVRNRTLLSERIAPFVLRRTKPQVAKQLPPKLFNEVLVELNPLDRKIYARIVNEFSAWLKSEGREAKEANKLTQLIRMQQFVDAPDLLASEDAGESDLAGMRGSKFEMLRDIIKEHDGRILVFTRFSQMANRLLEWLELPQEATIQGSVKPEERVSRVERFNNGELGDVFISTDAGAHGLSYRADMVVHYDGLWNPAVMRQREDRAWGIGRGIEGRATNVVFLLGMDTIDVGMHHVVQERQELFNEIMDGAEDAIIRAIDLRKAASGQPQARKEKGVA